MFKGLFTSKSISENRSIEERVAEIIQKEVPSHIAIIMDGNGRWAKKRALPRIAGHHEGMKAVKKVTRIANRLGVNYLTVYAFSTENWKRPQTEVEYIMRLPEEFLTSYLPELIEENVRVTTMGDFEKLPPYTKKAVLHAMEATKDNTGLVLNFALNYGSRSEIVDAMKSLIEKVKADELSTDDISDEMISQHLMSNFLPDPDLLIRTSGELRLSNFMLWQIAYAEFCFTDTLWPDFNEHSLLDAVEEYQSRNRRFGGLKGES